MRPPLELARDQLRQPNPALPARPATLFAEIHHHLAVAHYAADDPACEAEIRAARDKLRALESTVAHPGPVFLTAAEAAAFLRVSESWLKAQCRCGALPAAKAGKSWKIAQTDLDRFVASQGR